MRGSMFVEFLAHVEEQHGMETVDAIVEKTQHELSNAGAYTSVGNYPHGELLALATALANEVEGDLGNIVHEYADHIMQSFKRTHPKYFELDDAFDFLVSVGELIHIDVRKLYPDANPPEVRGERQSNNALLLHYKSHRPLAALAISLAKHTGPMFDQDIDVEVLALNDTQTAVTLKLSKSG